jgi:hypothetical protein
VLRIFEHVSALGYADDLKLFKKIVCRNGVWKTNWNVSKCESHVHRIGEKELERIEELKDLGVILDKMMMFLTHTKENYSLKQRSL